MTPRNRARSGGRGCDEQGVQGEREPRSQHSATLRGERSPERSLHSQPSGSSPPHATTRPASGNCWLDTARLAQDLVDIGILGQEPEALAPMLEAALARVVIVSPERVADGWCLVTAEAAYGLRTALGAVARVALGLEMPPTTCIDLAAVEAAGRNSRVLVRVFEAPGSGGRVSIRLAVLGAREGLAEASADLEPRGHVGQPVPDSVPGPPLQRLAAALSGDLETQIVAP